MTSSTPLPARNQQGRRANAAKLPPASARKGAPPKDVPRDALPSTAASTPIRQRRCRRDRAPQPRIQCPHRRGARFRGALDRAQRRAHEREQAHAFGEHAYGARAPGPHRENVLGEALAMMTKRLDDIEHKVVDGQQPSISAALQAVEKSRRIWPGSARARPRPRPRSIAARAAQAEQTRRDADRGNAPEQGRNRKPSAAPRRKRRPCSSASRETIENALRSFEDASPRSRRKLAETNSRSQQAQARHPPRAKPPTNPRGERPRSGLAAELQSAVAEIRARQSALDAEEPEYQPAQIRRRMLSHSCAVTWPASAPSCRR